MTDTTPQSPSMAEAMQDLVEGYTELIQHNREHHPELNVTGAEADFDTMTATLRVFLDLGIKDTPDSWESVMAGFIFGVRTLASLGLPTLLQVTSGTPQTNIPELLAFHFAIAKRWQVAGDTKTQAILDALAADGT